MTWVIIIQLVLLVVVPGGVFVLRNILQEAIKNHFDSSIARLEDKLEWRQQTRLKCERIAEYMVLARGLNADDPPERFDKANRMAFELALWLPHDTYRIMAQSLMGNRTEGNNEFEALLSLRKSMLGEDAGTLKADDLLIHGPNIGRGSSSLNPNLQSSQ